MLTLLGSMTGPERVAAHNENARRRFTPDVRTSADADTTQTTDDELIVISATTAPRTLTLLPAASANALYVNVAAADPTNDLTIDGDGDLLEGAGTLVLTAATKLLLVPDGTSWSIFTFA